MPDDTAAYPHPAAFTAERIYSECEVNFVRRSGPGGQHRNKVSTGVVLTHRPTGVKAEAAERRSQAENRAAALFRLRVNLALQIRCVLETGAAAGRAGNGTQPGEIDYRPSALWRSRCRGGRIELNAEHDDFPAMLAEALDLLAIVDFDHVQAAARLGCSATQLVKLLKKEPRALALANAERQRRDLHPLR